MRPVEAWRCRYCRQPLTTATVVLLSRPVPADDGRFYPEGARAVCVSCVDLLDLAEPFDCAPMIRTAAVLGFLLPDTEGDMA